MVRQFVVTSLFVCTLFGSEALAFHYPSEFAQHPFTRIFSGSGGNYYTGSPRSMGMDCSSCHIGAQNYPNRLALQVTTYRVNGTALEAYDLFASGYQPGQRYRIEVAFVGEHLGKELTSGQYENPAGSPRKVACLGQPFFYNTDQFTAEVVSDSGVYADSAGNAAGRLRPEAGDDTTEGSCRRGPLFCGGAGDDGDIPLTVQDGGPRTIMLRSWRLDPNTNAPLGSWSCPTECEAIVSNVWLLNWFDSPTNPVQRVYPFFWTAPATPPPAAGGRIRFYMAAVDGDAHIDAFDDDVALKKLAVCPAGSTPAQCDRNIPGFDASAVPPVYTPPTGPGLHQWLLASLLILLSALLVLTLRRFRRKGFQPSPVIRGVGI